jgi:hypothetical protein
MNYNVLLQTVIIQTADKTTMYITVGIVAAFLILLVIGANSGKSGRRSSSSGISSSSKPSSQRAGRKKFRKYSKNLELNQLQIKLLEDMAKRYKVPSPLNFFTNTKIFNTTLKKAINDFENGSYAPQVRESYKMALFGVKQKLDRYSGTKKSFNTTRQLKTGLSITLVSDSKVRYQSHVVANLKDAVCISIPLQSDGSYIRWKKWQQLDATFWEKGDKGFSFKTKVMGYSNIKNETCIMLQHTNSLSQSQQRRFPRKELGKHCYFFKINIMKVGRGKNRQKKAVLADSKGRLGNILEISAGGCSIKSGNSLQKGELIKINLDMNGKKMGILGKIVNIGREGPGTSTMHIQFTTISCSNLNSINTFIYGIDEKGSILDY